jgi:hypothetical protein
MPATQLKPELLPQSRRQAYGATPYLTTSSAETMKIFPRLLQYPRALGEQDAAQCIGFCQYRNERMLQHEGSRH